MYWPCKSQNARVSVFLSNRRDLKQTWPLHAHPPLAQKKSICFYYRPDYPYLLRKIFTLVIPAAEVWAPALVCRRSYMCICVCVPRVPRFSMQDVVLSLNPYLWPLQILIIFSVTYKHTHAHMTCIRPTQSSLLPWLLFFPFLVRWGSRYMICAS